MKSVLDRPAQSAVTASCGASGTTRPTDTFPDASGGPVCPECMEPFHRVHPRQLFCSPAHKKAFHNRATARGLTLAPVAIAARATRDGSTGDKDTGKRARRESRRLMDRWAREDREAGRMSMVDYMAARWRIGY